MMARQHAGQESAHAPCVFFACRLVCPFSKDQDADNPAQNTDITHNKHDGTDDEASPAALSAAMIHSRLPWLPGMSAAISSYVTEPTTDKRNHDHGTPRTAARLNRLMTMEMEGTME